MAAAAAESSATPTRYVRYGVRPEVPSRSAPSLLPTAASLLLAGPPSVGIKVMTADKLIVSVCPATATWQPFGRRGGQPSSPSSLGTGGGGGADVAYDGDDDDVPGRMSPRSSSSFPTPLPPGVRILLGVLCAHSSVRSLAAAVA